MGLSPRHLLKSSLSGSGNDGASSNNNIGTQSARSPSPSTHSGHSNTSSPIVTNRPYSSTLFHSTQSAESYAGSNAIEQKSLEDILRIVGEQKLCIVRKHGAQEETLIKRKSYSQINSIVDSVAKDVNVMPLYLHITQKAAGRLLNATNRNGLPLIYVNGDLIGGLTELRLILKSDFIANALRPHDYDLIVVGASPGGIAAATKAAVLGKNVILIDIQSTNVKSAVYDGAVEENHFPVENCDSGLARRLLCEAVVHRLKTSAIFHFENFDNSAHGMAALRELVLKQTRRINKRQKSFLNEAQIRVINAQQVFFCNTHELSVMLEDGRQQGFCADKFLIALAGSSPTNSTSSATKRNEGLKHSINVNEFFSKYILNDSKDPMNLNILCVNNEEKALEVVTIASAFGHNATILSSPDTKLSNVPNEFKLKLRTDLTQRFGIQFLHGTLEKCERQGDGNALRVQILSLPAKTDVVKDYNLIINCDDSAPFANDATLNELEVTKLNIKSSVTAQLPSITNSLPPNVYMLDNCQNAKLARNLVGQIYDGYLDELKTHDHPTVIMTPISYAACGFSIEQAISQFGVDNLSLYSTEFYDIFTPPVETDVSAPFLCKMICLLSDQERVLGAQLFAPNAYHLIDVFALAVKMEARRNQLDSLDCGNEALSEILQCLQPVPVPSFS